MPNHEEKNDERTSNYIPKGKKAVTNGFPIERVDGSHNKLIRGSDHTKGEVWQFVPIRMRQHVAEYEVCDEVCDKARKSTKGRITKSI